MSNVWELIVLMCSQFALIYDIIRDKSMQSMPKQTNWSFRSFRQWHYSTAHCKGLQSLRVLGGSVAPLREFAIPIIFIRVSTELILYQSIETNLDYFMLKFDRISRRKTGIKSGCFHGKPLPFLTHNNCSPLVSDLICCLIFDFLLLCVCVWLSIKCH